MRKLIGYTLFCVAAGMVIGMIIESIVWSMILILLMLLLGYNLFCC